MYLLAILHNLRYLDAFIVGTKTIKNLSNVQHTKTHK